MSSEYGSLKKSGNSVTDALLGKIASLEDALGAQKSRIDWLEDRLRDHPSRSFYQAAVEYLADGFFVCDMEGRFLDANQQACDSLGYTRDELLTLHTYDVDPQSPRTGVGERLVRRLDANELITNTVRHRRKDGTTFPVEIRMSRYKADGRSLILALARDISDREQADHELRIRRDALEAKNAELERFVYTVSHDLKSPLVTIRGFLDLLREDVISDDKPAVSKDMSTIADAAGRMSDLLDQLLHLGRLGQTQNALETVSMQSLVQAISEAMLLILEDHGVALYVADDLPDVRGDRVRLLEVWQNLVENAVKYAHSVDEPVIEIGWRNEQPQPLFYVRDNGIGIEPAYHETVFGLFQKLSSDEAGSGAGLAIVKRIVETHGGRVWVESAGDGQGSTFCFTLGES